MGARLGARRTGVTDPLTPEPEDPPERHKCVGFSSTYRRPPFSSTLFFFGRGLFFSVWWSMVLPGHQIFPVEQGGSLMGKNLFTLLFVSVLVFPLATAVYGQEAPAKEKVAKETRWEGTGVRSSPEKSTLTVRKSGSAN